MANSDCQSTFSAILAQLLFESGLKLKKLKPARAFQESTNLSHMTFRRYGAMAFAKYADKIRTYQRETSIPKQMRSWGVPADEITSAVSSMPENGPVALFVFGLGFRAPEVSGHLLETVVLLDNADARLFAKHKSNDIQGCLDELGPDSPLGPDYCQPLNVAGIGPLAGRTASEGPGLIEWARVRRAHMALSLLAALDHEMSIWREQQVGDPEWAGVSRFATLLLEPKLDTPKRRQPDDPFARLVDLVGVLGALLEDGEWPTRPPKISEMGRRVDNSNLVDLLGTTFIRKLRDGQLEMTDRYFRQLVLSQVVGSSKNAPFEPLNMASMLLPYLLAAQIFTLLIPKEKGSARLDRAGWRNAYLDWWCRHAIALGRPVERVNFDVPLWITDPTV